MILFFYNFLVKSRGKAKEGATSGWFAKFPQDVIRSEKLTGGDMQILEKDPYVDRPVEKINYKEIFGDPKEKEKLAAKAAKRKNASMGGGVSSPKDSPKNKKANKSKSPPRPVISHPRFKPGGEQHQVRIMQQPSTPYHLDLQKKEEENKTSKPQGSDAGMKCNFCDFTTTRMNVLMMHVKYCEHAKKGTPSPKSLNLTNKYLSTKSPATTPSPRGRGRGRGRGSSTATTPSSRATPNTKVSKTPDTPKSARGRGAGTPKSTRGRGGAGRGRPPKEKSSVEASSSTAVTPVKEKKPVKISKKKKEQMEKEEKEKKIEERKKILGNVVRIKNCPIYGIILYLKSYFFR